MATKPPSTFSKFASKAKTGLGVTRRVGGGLMHLLGKASAATLPLDLLWILESSGLHNSSLAKTHMGIEANAARFAETPDILESLGQAGDEANLGGEFRNRADHAQSIYHLQRSV